MSRAFRRAPTHAFDSSFTFEMAAIWSQSIRRLVRGRIADPGSVSAATEARWVHGDIDATYLVFSDLDGLRFRGTLLSPRCAERGTLVVLPGRNAVHAQVVGLESPDHPQRCIALHLADRGYRTLTLDYGLVDALKGSPGDRDVTSLLDHALSVTGLSLAGCLAADAVAALSWCENEAVRDVHAHGFPLALVGHSLGGHIALHAALAFSRPIPLVLASCVAAYSDVFWDDLKGGGAHALPGIRERADFADLIAAQAPAPLQVQMGTEDSIFPVAAAERNLNPARDAYHILSADYRFDEAVLEMGHGIDADRAAHFIADAFANAAIPASVPVPPVRIGFDEATRREALERIDDSLTTGSLTLGETGRAFEAEAARWIGDGEVVAVSSGTSALEIAFRCVGVAGRTVLISADTFFATASAAMAAGAKVDFVDIEPVGLGMDPAQLKEALERREDVAAVVVVHVGGFVSPCLPEIAALCAQYNVALIEDAAHALGSQLGGKPAGSFGRLAAFSFYPTKVVTSGEGGLVVAQRPDDANAARSMRDHGKVDFHANIHELIGSNWRMSEIHAAVGLAHLRRLDRFIRDRRAAAAYFDKSLSIVKGLSTVPEPADVKSNYYKYMVRLSSEVDRASLKARLHERHGVILSGEVYDPPCYMQPALGGGYSREAFPVAAAFCRQHVCLPIFPGITTTEQDRTVCALIEELTVPTAISSSHPSAKPTFSSGH